MSCTLHKLHTNQDEQVKICAIINSAHLTEDVQSSTRLTAATLTINCAPRSQDIALDLAFSGRFGLLPAHAHVLVGLPHQLHEQFPDVRVRLSARLNEGAVPGSGGQLICLTVFSVFSVGSCCSLQRFYTYGWSVLHCCNTKVRVGGFALAPAPLFQNVTKTLGRLKDAIFWKTNFKTCLNDDMPRSFVPILLTSDLHTFYPPLP